MARAFRPLALLSLCGVLVGCANNPPPPPTDPESIEKLEEMQKKAREGEK